MNWDQVEGRWHELKGKARERWGRITEDEFATIGGKKEALAGTIQRVYGKTKEEVQRDIEQWTKDCGCR